MTADAPWTPSQATDEIRKIARSVDFTISYKVHAQDRLVERGLIMSDVLYVLKNGFVYDPNPEPSTREGYHKYAIESRCPNGSNRDVRVIVIPDKKAKFLKIISVMWVDEVATRAGTLTGEANG